MMATCPHCGAAGSDPCTTPSGKPASSTHKARTSVTRTPRQLEAAIAAATASATWLTGFDAAAIDVAMTIARKIDDQVWTAEHVAVGTLFEDAALGRLEGGIVYDIQTLHSVLTSLGLTPKGRADLRLEDHDDHDELGQILEIYADA